MSMAIISYILGQKYYPINYPLNDIIWYIFSGILLIGVSISMNNIFEGDMIVFYLVNIICFGLFIYQLIKLEKIDIKQMLTKVLPKAQ
jgi:hypothetical protein